MDNFDKVKFISSRAVLRVQHWHDEFGHWRGGVDWYGEDDYKFICEKPTLEEVLDCIYKI